MTLDEFLESPSLRNAWIKRPIYSYVRRGNRWFNGETIRTFELSNLPQRETYRNGQFKIVKYRRGKFRDFMIAVESSGQFDAIYVENATTDRIVEICQKQGYLPLNGTGDGLTSWVKILKPSKRTGEQK